MRGHRCVSDDRLLFNAHYCDIDFYSSFSDILKSPQWILVIHISFHSLIQIQSIVDFTLYTVSISHYKVINSCAPIERGNYFSSHTVYNLGGAI